MANPAPRPALRKAPDAHINPAHPNRNDIDLRETRPVQAPPIRLRDDAAPTLDSVIGADKPAAGMSAVTTQTDVTSTHKHQQDEKAIKQKKSKPAKPTKSKKKSGKGGAGEKTKSKSAKTKKKHANRATSSGKMTLSAEARRKLRAADKARGATLDSTVDALVADLRTPNKG